MGKPWFVQKKFGAGLSPSWPAGWIALAIFVIVLSATNFGMDALHLPLWLFLVVDAIETAVFFVLMWMKNDGKPLRWRWGEARDR